MGLPESFIRKFLEELGVVIRRTHIRRTHIFFFKKRRGHLNLFIRKFLEEFGVVIRHTHIVVQNAHLEALELCRVWFRL